MAPHNEKETNRLEEESQAKVQAKQSARLVAAASPPRKDSPLDQDVEAKTKAKQSARLVAAASPPKKDTSTPLDRDIEAKVRARLERFSGVSSTAAEPSWLELCDTKPSAAKPSAVKPSAATEMQAKQRERQLRKEASLSQRSLMSTGSDSACSAHKERPTSIAATLQIKESERQLRKDLSRRSIKPSDSTRSLFVSKSPKVEDTSLVLKESERQLRADLNRSFAGNNSARSLDKQALKQDNIYTRADSMPSSVLQVESTETQQDLEHQSSTMKNTLKNTAAEYGEEADSATLKVGAFHATDLPQDLDLEQSGLCGYEHGAIMEEGLEKSICRSSIQEAASLFPVPRGLQQMQEETTAKISAASSTPFGANLIEATLVDEKIVEATVATAVEIPRDVVSKIRDQSAKETTRIRIWRIIVSTSLMVTAVAVTVSTYFLLLEREDQNFRNVYDQFAHTVADAAVEFQSTLRHSLRSFSNTVATMAEAAGGGTSPWPYFVVDRWETLGQGFKSVSNAEFVATQNFVTHDQRETYVDFITPIYQDFVKEAHMEAYGHLDFLNQNTSYYQPFIARKLSNGTFVPDIDRDHYFCRTTQSPPARKYGPTINNNLISNQVIADGFAVAMELGNEPVFTPIKPFANVPASEHAKMHSNGAEGVNNPHSFTFYPVHRVPGNDSSDIVAMFAVATAWDFSMLNLLPDSVKGMYCVVQNTCNQTVTYRIDGGEATYLGEGELQNMKYDDLAVYVDLNLQVHPKAASTPGHCMYSMKIYPSEDFEDDYKTNTPIIYASVVAGTFVLIAITLIIYDRTVTKRNEKMIFQAAKTNAILSKFVPDDLRDRIMGFESRDVEESYRGV